MFSLLLKSSTLHRPHPVLCRSFATAAAGEKSKPEKRITYKNKNFYHILQVDTKISDKELKAQYFKLAKIYHPDVYKGINTEHFKKLAEAYNTLKNPKKRKEYDNRLKASKRTTAS